MISDTHPEAEAVQIELLRKATFARRSALTFSLTNMVRYQARRAIERAHPELSKQDRDLLFVEIHYGKDLAEQVRKHLRSRGK